PQRTEDRPCPTPFDVRYIGRELRAKDEHGVARLQEGLAEELLEDLGSRPDDYVVRFHGDVKLCPVVSGNRLAECRKTERGTVVRGAFPNRLGSGIQGTARGRERTVADLQLDNVFATGLEPARHSQ